MALLLLLYSVGVYAGWRFFPAASDDYERRGGDVDGGGAQLLAKYGVRFNRYVTQSAADDGSEIIPHTSDSHPPSGF